MIEGQHRFQALKNLGFDKIPTIKIYLADDYIKNISIVKQILKNSGIRHSDNINRILTIIGEILFDENGNVNELMNYEPPKGYEIPWNNAINYIINNN